MSVPVVEVTDRIRVPTSLMRRDDVADRYVVTLFKDSKCRTCSNLPDRDPNNELCESCPNFEGVYRFFNSKEAKAGTYSLPQSDIHAIHNYLERRGKPFKWVDKRTRHKFENPIKFTGKLYTKGDKDEFGNPRADQVRLVERWMKKKTGKIIAAARTGKTVMGTNIYCRLGARTVIIAGKKKLLKQFYETAVGKSPPKFRYGKFVPAKTKSLRKSVTNIAELQQETGKQIIFMPDNFAQLEKFLNTEIPDILLITYQSFIKDFARVANVINKYYSFSIVDEEHRTGAEAYFRFIASLDLVYRLGLTATPDRKDGRSKLARLIYGPIVAKSETVTLKPVIEFYPVKAKPQTNHKSWIGAQKWAKTNQKRCIEIIQMAFNDMRKGHNVIVIPVEHKDHMQHLVKMFNHQAKINREKRGERWPKILAKAYHSGVKDEEEDKLFAWVDTENPKEIVSKKLPTRSPRVLIAVLSMIKEGVDMRRPSMLYSIIPMSGDNEVGAPMFFQTSYRVCTPYPKPQPVVRVFVDNIKMFASCAASLLYTEVLPRSQLKMKNEARYILADYNASRQMITARTSKSPTSGAQGVKYW